jgi:hypothetical protein
MKFLNRTGLISLLLIITGFVFLLLFYFDLNKKITISEEDAIGTITFKINSMQRKFDSSVVWRAVESNSLLKNRDTIKTYPESDAVIRLKDGTEIQVDENSMIFLDINEKSHDIKFEGGSIEIKNSNSTSSDKKLKLDYKGKQLELDKSDAKIDGSKDGKSLSIDLKKGVATLNDGSGNSKKINENEIANLEGNNLSISKPTFILKEPSDQKKMYLFSNSSKVNFAWSETVSHSGVSLQISQSKAFAKLEKSSFNSSSGSAELKQGIYYWRVIGKNSSTGKEEFSEVRRISLIRENQLSGFMPAQDKVFSKNSGVNFTWSEAANVKEYILEISENPNFTNPRTYTTNINFYVLKDLPEGIYYWRVRTRSNISDLPEMKSEVKMFTIGTPKPKEEVAKDVKQAKESKEAKEAKEIADKNSKEKKEEILEKLVLLSPSHKSKLILKEEPKPISFTWSSTTSKKFKFILSKDSGFKSIITEKTISSKSTSILIQEEGNYFWKIISTNDKKNSTNSTVNTFTVKKEVKKEVSVKLISPLNQTIDPTNTKSILFKWNKLAETSSYKFVIKNNKKVFFSTTVNKNEFKFDKLISLEEGSFIWEVTPILEGKTVIASKSKMEIRLVDDPLKKLKPDEIKVLSPDTIYRE